MRTAYSVLVLLVALACSPLLRAQDHRPNFNTVAGYLAGSREDFATSSYLIGAYNAYDHVNAMMMHQGKTPLFCPPANLKLQISNINQLLDDLFTRMRKVGQPIPGEAPLEPFMFAALIQAFPCSPA